MPSELENKTELPLPDWLDNVFLETALRSGESDPSIKVISSEIRCATAPGDNFGSDMYRALVQITREGQTEERSIIIKAAKNATTGEMNKMLNECDIFEREINTFRLIFPAMYCLTDSIQTHNYQPFAARYLYSYLNKSIVLEDLKKQGFILAKTKFGLDLKHCLLVLRTIARFHASSLVLYQNNPECLEPFLESPFSEEQDKMFQPVLTSSMKGIAKAVKTWPEYERLNNINFNKLDQSGMDQWLSAMQRDDSSFNVLTHGDLWMNNMMFRYSDDTEEVMDVRFVDFQGSHWTSPAVDLLYFFCSSASPDVLEKFDFLIEEYHTYLCNTLTLLGYKSVQPSLTQLNEDIQKRGIIGPISAFLTRTVALGDRTKVPDLNRVLANEEDIYLSEAYITTLKILIPLFETRGWLQIK